MSSKFRNTLCFISLLLFIYTMRQANLSPTRLLANHITRFAQEQKLSETYCIPGRDNLTFSESKKSRASDFRDGLQDIRDERTLGSYIERDVPNDTFLGKYGRSYIPYLLPWVIFMGLGLIGCLGYLINWCCMTCPCTRNRICSCCRAPKTPKYKNCFAILSILFMVFTVGAGVAGIYFITKFPTYSGGALCSITRFLEETKDGSQEYKWIGVEPGITAVDDVIGNIRRAVSGMDAYDLLIARYTQSLDQLSTNLNTLYTNFQDRTLARIAPNAGTYQPVYIQTLGPPTQDGTTTNRVAAELETGRQNLEESQNALTGFKNQVRTQTDAAINDIQSQRPRIVKVNDYIDQAIDKIAEERSTINTVIDVISGVLLGLFIANTAVGAVALLAILLVCCRAKFFNKAIHLAWCVLGLLMIVSYATSAFLLGATILLSEGCDVGNAALVDPVFFNKTFNKITSAYDVSAQDRDDTRDVLYRCFHGDGDLTAEFDIKENLFVFDNIFEGINQLSTESQQNIDELPQGIGTTEAQSLGLVRTGVLPDSQDTVIDIETLSGLTNRATNPCITLDDSWRLNSLNCTNNQGTVFQANSETDFNVPDATCIGYNAWSADQRDPATRYSQADFSGTNCNNGNNAAFVTSFVDSLATNREASNELIDELGTAITQLGTEYTAFKNLLQTTPVALRRTNATVNAIYTSITEPNTGLISQANCKLIAESAWDAVDATCIGLAALSYETTITFLVLSFVSFFGTFFLFCLAKRFIVMPPKKKADPNVYMVKA